MKRIMTALMVLIMTIGLCGVCIAAEDESIGITAIGSWHIFSKNMEDKELLDSVGMSARDINKILESTNSESIIVNSETGAHIYVKIYENDKSKELWNISAVDDSYLKQNLDDLLHKAFLIHELEYNVEDVKVSCENPYIKQIIIPGSTHYEGSNRGMIVSATVVNGKAIGFVMETKGEVPTQDEIAELEEVTQGIEITKILDKDEKDEDETSKPVNYTRYLIGGAIVLVVLVFGALAMKKMKTEDEEDGDSEE